MNFFVKKWRKAEERKQKKKEKSRDYLEIDGEKLYFVGDKRLNKTDKSEKSP